MQEHQGLITMHGAGLTLLGNRLSVGDAAPAFTLMNGEIQPVGSETYRGKVCIISTVPSLDTPVCDMETRRFNQEASGLGENVEIVTVSMDLPFAQKRWCAAAGVERVTVLSDYLEGAFGTAYGVLIKELRLLARAVFLIDRKGTIRYIELVKELTKEPDYEKILASAKPLL